MSRDVLDSSVLELTGGAVPAFIHVQISSQYLRTDTILLSVSSDEYSGCPSLCNESFQNLVA